MLFITLHASLTILTSFVTLINILYVSSEVRKSDDGFDRLLTSLKIVFILCD